MSIQLQHFDGRRVWSTYTGQVWPDEEETRATDDARKFYERAPHIWIGGVRLVDRAGRILWSIAAEPTYRLEIDWQDGKGWERMTDHESWSLSRVEAEQGRDRCAAWLKRPVRFVQEDYPRESAPVELVETSTFSAPAPPQAPCVAGRPVAPVIFQFGGERAA